jgi:hypothetical protein
MNAVPVDEAGNPTLAHGSVGNFRRKISYHLSRRRQTLLSKLLNIPYKLQLLLRVEYTSIEILGLPRHLRPAVSSAEC